MQFKIVENFKIDTLDQFVSNELLPSWKDEGRHLNAFVPEYKTLIRLTGIQIKNNILKYMIKLITKHALLL